VHIVASTIAAEGGVTPFQVQVLQRAFLEGVADIGVTLPLFAVAISSEVFAGEIAGHEGQAGNTDGCEVEIVASLPGLLVSLGEITNLYVVHQEGVDVTAHIGEA